MSDLDGYCFVKRKGALVPRDFHSDELMDRIKDGREIMITPRLARNPRHHRLLFAMLAKVVKNTELYDSVDVLLDELKLATGLAEIRVNIMTGKPYAVPGHINFAAMGQDKFDPWFHQAAHLLATRILKCAPQELVDEIVAMCSERKP